MAIFNSYVSLPEGKSLKLAPFGQFHLVGIWPFFGWDPNVCDTMWYHIPPQCTKYPLGNVYITMENHHFSWLNPLFQWPFSIAMLVYQRYPHSPHKIPAFSDPAGGTFSMATQAFPNVENTERSEFSEVLKMNSKYWSIENWLSMTSWQRILANNVVRINPDLWKNSLWLKQNIRHITYNIYNIQNIIYRICEVVLSYMKKYSKKNNLTWMKLDIILKKYKKMCKNRMYKISTIKCAYTYTYTYYNYIYIYIYIYIYYAYPKILIHVYTYNYIYNIYIYVNYSKYKMHICTPIYVRYI